MKVICIKQGDWVSTYDGRPMRGPKFGEECTVDGLAECGFYYLKGYDFTAITGRIYYSPKRFIPLSSIDETEMQRDYKTEKVCG